MYDEASKITEQDQNSNNFQPDNPLAAYVPNRNRLQLELKMKKLIQNRIATHFPQNNQVSITNQMSNSSQVSPVKQTQNRYPAGGDEVDGANQLSGKEMKPVCMFCMNVHRLDIVFLISKRDGGGFSPKGCSVFIIFFTVNTVWTNESKNFCKDIDLPGRRKEVIGGNIGAQKINLSGRIFLAYYVFFCSEDRSLARDAI